ncbi:MAG: NADH-quinone oxidoreductase subunit C [Actinomycetia bacterium]|nr:NADH-quinone oxidoreductase subunit C [Actinomycetes bacterium]
MSSADEPTTGEPAVDEPEADELRDGLVRALADELGQGVLASHVIPGTDLWIRLDNAAWAEAGRVLRNKMGFGFFSWLSAIDWLPSPYGRSMDAVEDVAAGLVEAGPDDPGEIEQGVTGGETRFQVIARLYSLHTHTGITVKADVADESPSIASWVSTFAGADWHERETWEMFGIAFEGHPGLRHIYLPGDFEGHPLRKDYPLVSRIMKPWPGLVDVEAIPEMDA